MSFIIIRVNALNHVTIKHCLRLYSKFKTAAYIETYNDGGKEMEIIFLSTKHYSNATYYVVLRRNCYFLINIKLSLLNKKNVE